MLAGAKNNTTVYRAPLRRYVNKCPLDESYVSVSASEDGVAAEIVASRKEEQESLANAS